MLYTADVEVKHLRRKMDEQNKQQKEIEQSQINQGIQYDISKPSGGTEGPIIDSDIFDETNQENNAYSEYLTQPPASVQIDTGLKYQPSEADFSPPVSKSKANLEKESDVKMSVSAYDTEEKGRKRQKTSEEEEQKSSKSDSSKNDEDDSSDSNSSSSNSSMSDDSENMVNQTPI